MTKVKIFLELLNRVPHSKVLVGLIFISGLAEGIGLSSLLPLVSNLTSKNPMAEISAPFNRIPYLLNQVGLEATFDTLLFITLGVMCLSFYTIYLQQCLAAHANVIFLQDLRNKATNNIFSSSWEHLLKLPSGEISNKIINEAERGAESIIALVNICATFFLLIIYGAFALILSWRMFLIALGTIFLAIIFGRRLIRAVKRTGENKVQANTNYSRQLVEFIKGVKLIKATSLEPIPKEKLFQSNSSTLAALKEILISSAKMRMELQIIVSCAMVGILYIAIRYLSIPISTLLVFMYIIMRLTPKFSTLQGQYHSFSAQYPSLKIVDELIKSAEHNLENYNEHLPKLGQLSGHLTISNLHYSYPETTKNVIDGISLEIKPHQFIAFVGRSGSGKTTLIDLIMGLMLPKSGKILVDGTSIEDINLFSYREKIGLVSQESVFFSGTIRENLDPQNILEENEIWNNLRISQLKEFIESLPQKLETVIGEAGINISGGQSQRLAIARALCRRPSLLILDEATSSLDSESESKFQKAVEAISHRYTIIAVAHRLSTIRKADQIYVIDQGRIADQGTFAQLTGKEGLFSDFKEFQILS